MNYYYIIYKPYQVLTQFSPSVGKKTLADYFAVPSDVYPVGRLDYDSEGLLILTNDTQLNHRLLNPKHKHEREYYVQVDGEISREALQQLIEGVEINIDGKMHLTQPSTATRFDHPPDVPERVPPIRHRKQIPTSWISLTLHEGKNRQVRKMTAKVGYPTLRLIRYRIEGLTIEDMQPGDMFEIRHAEIYRKLFTR